MNPTYSYTGENKKRQFSIGENHTDQNLEESLSKLVAVKDRYLISDEALHEIHMLYEEVPPLAHVKRERSRQSTTINIQESRVMVTRLT